MEAPDDSSGDPEREGVIEDALRSTSLAILRSLTFAGSAFLFGFPVFVLLVLRPSLTERSETDLGGARHASGRRAEELLRSALVATLTAAILTLLLQATLIAQVRGGELGWSSISSVLGTSFGTWSAVRVPILAGLAVLVVGRTRTALVTDPGGTWWAMWVVVAGFLLLTISEADTQEWCRLRGLSLTTWCTLPRPGPGSPGSCLSPSSCPGPFGNPVERRL
jgi:hypothetical protein